MSAAASAAIIGTPTRNSVTIISDGQTSWQPAMQQ
jgi:hypothetical protein